MSILRRIAVVTLMIMSSGAVAPVRVAAVPPGYHTYRYSVFDHGWSTWEAPNGTPVGTAQLTFDPECGWLLGNPPFGPSGVDEFNFSFSVGLGPCVSTEQTSEVGPTSVDLLLATFTWAYSGGNDEFVEFPCLDVVGAAEGPEGINGEVVFGRGVPFGTSSATRTSEYLSDVTVLTFDVIMTDFQVLFGTHGDEVEEQRFEALDVEISIRPCEWDGPDIDIEHYRQMAEQAEALPNTR